MKPWISQKFPKKHYKFLPFSSKLDQLKYSSIIMEGKVLPPLFRSLTLNVKGYWQLTNHRSGNWHLVDNLFTGKLLEKLFQICPETYNKKTVFAENSTASLWNAKLFTGHNSMSESFNETVKMISSLQNQVSLELLQVLLEWKILIKCLSNQVIISL